MNGQVKVTIPALIGIITLLLTGTTGCTDMPGEQQAINVAETRAATFEKVDHQELGTAFKLEANQAASEIGTTIVTDLAVNLKSNSAVQLAANVRHDERG